MRKRFVPLSALLLATLFGCGGGGSGISTVSNTHFQVVWPARSRQSLEVGLSSAVSASVLLQEAGADGTDVTLHIGRDPSQLAAHTETYTISQGIDRRRLHLLAATFYANASEEGAVVGNATASATLNGTSIEFTPITLVGQVKQVSIPPTSINLDSNSQLSFSAFDEFGQSVALTPGSATWSLMDGSQFMSLSADGIASPIAGGTAHVTVTVDGITSAPQSVQVLAPAPIYTWSGAKGGNLVTPTFPAVEGEYFQVLGGKDVVVTQLGFEVQRENQGSGTTAIFDSTGHLLASASISGSDTLLNGYYYKAIAPITLASGQRYYIGSLHGTGSAWTYYHNTNTASVPSFIGDLGTYFKQTSTIEGGSWQGSGPRHYIPNFIAQQVP